MYTPSQYQKAIHNWMVNGSGNAVIAGVPGCGKTTTIEAEARSCDLGDLIILAFNNHIKKELVDRGLPGATVHSTGYATIKRAWPRNWNNRSVDSWKMKKICKDSFSNLPDVAPDDEQPLFRALCETASKCKITLTNPRDENAIESLMDRFGITAPGNLSDFVVALTPVLIDASNKVAEDYHVIDFDDMLYLPARYNMPFRQFGRLMVDEAQDLSAASLEVVLRSIAPNGRAMAVGDPNQAIMGFAGADSQAFDRIKAALNAVQLPLSVSYRCPTSHLDLAREIVPHIESAPGAQVGIVGYIDVNEMQPMVVPGDMLLCRLTAPLIKTCIRLIAKQIPARVRGRDIGKQLVDIIDAVKKRQGYTWRDFDSHLSQHLTEQGNRLIKRHAPESVIESLQDRCEAVQVCYDNFGCVSADELAARIDGLFSDENGGVTLSTIHRAKGLETQRSFILRPDKLPLTWPKQREDEYQQEMNLRYVALTRAKRELYFVEGV